MSIAAAELYSLSSTLFAVPWLAAATINSLLAVLVVVLYKGKFDHQSYRPRPHTFGLRNFLNEKNIRPFLPALVIVLAAISAALLTATETMPKFTAIEYQQLLWVLWIPAIEELFFRVGIGNFFRRKFGFWLGCYGSALVFSLVHSMPTIERISQGKVGLPLGPFLLAISCELLYSLTGRVLPSALLHAACNLTSLIFTAIDERWLMWLDFLYS